MASVNKVILVGNLGRDPEVRYSPDGAAICNVSIATTSQWKDKASGEKREETEWHRVVFYNRLAEIDGEYQIGRATSELQQLMRISYGVSYLKKKKQDTKTQYTYKNMTNMN